jgi:hypothetical protein
MCCGGMKGGALDHRRGPGRITFFFFFPFTGEISAHRGPIIIINIISLIIISRGKRKPKKYQMGGVESDSTLALCAKRACVCVCESSSSSIQTTTTRKKKKMKKKKRV